MPVDAEDEHLVISKNRTATADVVFQHARSVTINRQYPLATVFLLLGLSLLNLITALWTKGMTPAKSLSALGAGQLKAALKVLDGDGALGKVYILNFDSQSFADPTARSK